MRRHACMCQINILHWEKILQKQTQVASGSAPCSVKPRPGLLGSSPCTPEPAFLFDPGSSHTDLPAGIYMAGKSKQIANCQGMGNPLTENGVGS